MDENVNSAVASEGAGRRRFLTTAAAGVGAGAALLGAGVATAPSAGATTPGSVDVGLRLRSVDLTASPSPAIGDLGADGIDGWVVRALMTRTDDIVYLTLRVFFGEDVPSTGIFCLDPADLDPDYRPYHPDDDVIMGGGQNFPSGIGYIYDGTRADPYNDPAQPNAVPVYATWADASNLGGSSPLLAFMPTMPMNISDGQPFVGQPNVPWSTPPKAGSNLFVSIVYLWQGATVVDDRES